MATYFKDDEIKGLDLSLVEMLDKLREFSGVPIVISSGLRTKEENDKLATSVPDSSHLKGLAVDLKCRDSQTRYRLVQAAFAVGFRRIGVETLHVHLDIDGDKPQECLFVAISS